MRLKGKTSYYSMRFFSLSSDIIRCWGQTVLAPMIPDCVALRVPAILKNMHMDTVPENVLCERNPGRNDDEGER